MLTLFRVFGLDLVMLRSIARLTRIDHGIMTAFATFAGIYAVRGFSFFNWKIFLLGGLSSLFIEMGLFVFNDIFNIEEDKVNDPSRPLVTGEINIETAYFIGIFSLIAGTILSIFLGFIPFLIIIVAIVTGMLYNIGLKKTGFIGNIIVAFDTALPFLYGASIVGREFGEKIILFYSIAFTATLGREIVKGIRDMRGDSRVNIRTVALMYGPRIASILAAFFMFIAVILSFIAFPYVRNIVWYAVLIGVTDIVFIVSSMLIVFKPEIDVAGKVRKITLFGMLLGILGFAGTA